MTAWLNAHKLLSIGLLIVVAILFWAGEEILCIMKDEKGNKGRRVAKQLIKAVAFCAALSGFVTISGIGGTLSQIRPLLAGLIIFHLFIFAIFVTPLMAYKGPAGQRLPLLFGAGIRILGVPGLFLLFCLLYIFIHCISHIFK
jgi:hypothetical protein